ncbi:MAG: 4-hydroxythreonine-4-phosphate dehydrogenase PdxA [Pedosphaera sp.]|nr:4-hydroxythreonine-4-phosphate dehydrogenase PdxA [Pedosphaera sp.]
MNSSLRIAISIGDPAGIGPEVVVKALADDALRTLAHWIVIGDFAAWALIEAQTGRQLGQFTNVTVQSPGSLTSAPPIGQLNVDCGRAALAYVRRAAELCLRGDADAMVTAPLNKEAVTLSGVAFTGHTEFIAELCGVNESWMLLINERLRVLHVTTHCSLRQACDLSTMRVLETLRIGHKTLHELALSRQRIAVCGLNPHAGEHGLFGSEDSRVIAPAVATARAEGIDAHGPFPADTIFLQALRGEFELVLAMYHDQGHIPMKLLDFDNTVNVSLGLPIVRTSVDHGTAFDIAGKNIANAGNMKAAMRLAVTLAQNRRRHA